MTHDPAATALPPPVDGAGTAPSPTLLRFFAVVRRAFAVGLASILAGVAIGGVGGRVAMRIAALAAPERVQGALTDAGNAVGRITAAGTAELIIFGGLFSGLFGGVLMVIVRPWLPGRHPSVAGAIVALAVGGPLLITARNRDFFLLDPALLNVAMFAGIVVAFGAVVPPLAARLERRIEALPEMSAYALAPLLALPALAGTSLFALLFSDSACGCNPAVGVGIGVVALGAASVARWAYEISGRKTPMALTVVGATIVAAVSAAGLVHLANEVSQIL